MLGNKMENLNRPTLTELKPRGLKKGDSRERPANFYNGANQFEAGDGVRLSVAPYAGVVTRRDM